MGVDLCIRVVIPSLFPFFLLSILLTSALMGCPLRLLRPLAALCRIPQGAESLLISGFLGGYPVGAQAVADAYRHRQLTKEDAQRLLAFCNNAGPAFLFGVVSMMFPRRWMVWALWGIHAASAVLVAIIFPGRRSGQTVMSSPPALTLSGALNIALRVMAAVCGWVVLFRVLIAFLGRWILWLLPAPAQVAVIGLLELSNGCYCLTAIEDISLRFIICAGMLAFGGVCVTMQTVSVTEGLSLRSYFSGKLLQTALSIALSWSVVANMGLPCFMILLISAVILAKKQKKSSIPSLVGV